MAPRIPKFYNLSSAARTIGISRPTLYAYFERFPPYRPGGHPVLTEEQVKMIKDERRAKTNRNGNRKAA